MGTGAHGPAFWPGRPGARLTRNRPVRPGPARGPGAVPGRVLIRNFRRDRPRRQFSARTATRGPAVQQIRKAHGASVSFYGLRKARSGIFPSPHTPSHAAVQVVRTRPPAQGHARRAGPGGHDGAYCMLHFAVLGAGRYPYLTSMGTSMPACLALR